MAAILTVQRHNLFQALALYNHDLQITVIKFRGRRTRAQYLPKDFQSLMDYSVDKPL